MLNLIKEKTVILIFHRNTNYLLGISIFMCLVLYIYFANMVVRTLTVVENTKYEIQSLSIEVGEMEAKRLLIQNEIGKVLAKSLGFVEISDKTFIINKTKKTALSFKTN